MSEFTKLSKEIHSCKDKIDSLSLQINGIKSLTAEELDYAVVSEILNKLNSLNQIASFSNESIEKFVNKMNYVDPVTEKARYGDNMKTKITQASEICQETLQQLNELLVFVQGRMNVAPKPVVPTEIIQEQLDVCPIDNSAEEAKLLKEKEEAELKRLHDEAEGVRLMKRSKLEIKRLVLDTLISLLDELRKNKLEVKEAIGQMLAPGSDAKLIKTAIMTIADILDKVNGKPDDARLRKLKLDHPVLHEKVVRVFNSYKLLLAVSFEFRLDEIEDSSETQSKYLDIIVELVYAEKSNNSAASAVETIKTYISSLFNNSEEGLDSLISMSRGLNRNLCMQMEEPVIDADGTTGFPQWIEWFDSLTINRDLLKSLAVKLS